MHNLTRVNFAKVQSSEQKDKKLEIMTKQNQILIISSDNKIPVKLKEALDGLSLDCCVCSPEQAISELAVGGSYGAAVMALERISNIENQDIIRLCEQLKKMSVNSMVLAREVGSSGANKQKKMLVAQEDESSEMLKGRLSTLVGMRSTFKELTSELKYLRTVNEPLNKHFSEVDEEMRLAACLQRDFLPRQLPNVKGITFSAIYRPATWVSGDIYDVMRLDEEHVGFYVADVVGHGMPAALMTMYIKRALVTKKIENNSYTLVEPGDALSHLNEDMLAQELSNFQFATCCYGILNTKTLKMRVASAGHPAPMRINSDAHETELEVHGSLLGVFPDQEYETVTHQLQWGDKILLYSDGVELAFLNEGPDKPLRFRKEFGDVAHCDVNEMTQRLLEIINSEEGSLHPRDDVTIVGIQLTQPQE